MHSFAVLLNITVVFYSFNDHTIFYASHLVVMASLELVVVAKLHCCVVPLDVYHSNQEKYSSLVSPLEPRGTVYLEREWATCLRLVSVFFKLYSLTIL